MPRLKLTLETIEKLDYVDCRPGGKKRPAMVSDEFRAELMERGSKSGAARPDDAAARAQNPGDWSEIVLSGADDRCHRLCAPPARAAAGRPGGTVTSDGYWSSRMPLRAAWRSTPLPVQPLKATSATIVGSNQAAWVALTTACRMYLKGFLWHFSGSRRRRRGPRLPAEGPYPIRPQ